MLSKNLTEKLQATQLNDSQKCQVVGGYRELPIRVQPSRSVRWEEVDIRFQNENDRFSARPGRITSAINNPARGLTSFSL